MLTYCINSLFESGVLADVEIVCQGRTWDLHKTILGVHCEFFGRALKDGWEEARMSRVRLDDEDPELVDFVLRWIYGQGEMPFSFTLLAGRAYSWTNVVYFLELDLRRRSAAHFGGDNNNSNDDKMPAMGLEWLAKLWKLADYLQLESLTLAINECVTYTLQSILKHFWRFCRRDGTTMPIFIITRLDRSTMDDFFDDFHRGVAILYQLPILAARPLQKKVAMLAYGLHNYMPKERLLGLNQIKEFREDLSTVCMLLSCPALSEGRLGKRMIEPNDRMVPEWEGRITHCVCCHQDPALVDGPMEEGDDSHTDAMPTYNPFTLRLDIWCAHCTRHGLNGAMEHILAVWPAETSWST